VYAREVDEFPEPLTFGVSGRLIMNALVMYDRETETLWSQILGRAVEGELLGARLTPLAALQTTWGQWKRLHPDSLALRKGYSGLYDPYDDYYLSERAGVLGRENRDERLPTKARGLGLALNGQAAYFPFQHLLQNPIVNAEVAGTPVLVVYHPATSTALAFKRSLGDDVLTFELDPESDEAAPVMIDAETGSRWRMFYGAAFEGALAGQSLERIPATTAFWFGWSDFYPDTYLYAP